VVRKPRGKTKLKDLGADVRIILKWVLKKRGCEVDPTGSSGMF
jgi:hypothetical protein